MIFPVNFFLEWSEDFLWFTNLPDREIIPTSTIVTNLATDEIEPVQFYVRKVNKALYIQQHESEAGE